MRVVVAVAMVAFAFGAMAQSATQQSPLNRGRGLFGRGISRPTQAAPQPAVQQPAVQQPTAQQSAATTPESTREALKNVPKGTNGVPALAFNQAPLELVLEAYAEQVKKTILPAPDLPKATITLNSLEGQTLTKEEYLEAIEAILTMNGVVLEPRGEKFLRALTRKTVRTQGIPLLMKMPDAPFPEKSRVVSQMITLRNVEATEAQKALEGFRDPNGLFQVFERTNSILVTDTQENVNRILEIVKALDVSTPILEDVFMRQIKYAVANDIKTALETIVTESQKEQPKEKVGVKTSGAPGFTRNQPTSPLGSRLLGLNRPGQQQQQPAAPTPNETLLASVSDADRGMIRGKVLILADERSNKLIIITSKANMDFFDRVIETLDVPTDPEFKVEVVRLKYAEAEDVASMLNDLIGGSSSSSQKSSQNQMSKNATNTKQNIGTQKSTTPAPGAPSGGNRTSNSVGDLNKDNCKVLADKRINGIVVMTRTELMPIIMSVIDNMDVKLSQVLIETVIIEISLDDNLTTGIDWVMGGEVAKSAFLNHGQMMGGGAGSTQLGSFAKESATSSSTVTPIGNGANYLVKSKKLNLAAVAEASKSDSRTKYIASPIVMTVDNKEATIEATASRQFLTGWSAVSSSYAGSGLPSPNYSAKDIGITLKITPKINPNGTVMLQVEEEYSQVSGKQSMLSPQGSSYTTQDIDVPVTRKMSADISLENMQSVILGGLTTKTLKDSETGIPILKDIPYIGKWLFGKVELEEQRSELLIFMTPYVLDDADSAKAEALRRKKTFSDPNPWDDNGWSASELADPVSKKEQLRRFKEEWAKQDEERANRLAVEKAKADRAEKIKNMTEAERKFWLELHREEIEREQKDAMKAQNSEQEANRELLESMKRKQAEDAAKANAAINEELRPGKAK